MKRDYDTLWRVRRAVGSGVILADEDTLAFNPACDYRLDVAVFRFHGI